MKTQFRSILVPVDFSEVSQVALEYALQLAKMFDASVEVLHAWVTPAYVSPSVAIQLEGPASAQSMEAIVQAEARRQMEMFLSSVPKPHGVEITTRIEFGFEAEVIVKAAASKDLVVMGTTGRAGLSRLMLGSVAEKVIRQAPCPVLTVSKAAATKEAA